MGDCTPEQELIQNAYIKTTELLQDKNRENLLSYFNYCQNGGTIEFSSGSSHWKNKIQMTLDNCKCKCAITNELNYFGYFG